MLIRPASSSKTTITSLGPGFKTTRVRLRHEERSALPPINAGMGDSLTPATPFLNLDLQAALMDQVQGFYSVPALYHT